MLSTPKDFLTNCYSREGLPPFLQKMEGDFVLYKRPFTILIMDVDHFKFFNDKYGHLNGDEVLKYFSSSMRLDLEDEENQPFRFGGDEFVMVFPNKTAGEAYALAARLRRNIKTRSCLIKGRQLTISFSGGIASYPRDARNIDDLLERADNALYYSKKHGRARITRYDEISFIKIVRIFLYVLVFIGGFIAVDLLTHDFSKELQRFKSWQNAWIKQMMSHKNHVILHPSAAPVVPPPAAAIPVVSQPPPAPSAAILPPQVPEDSVISRIYLKSGRAIQGRILSENENEVEVGLGLEEGKGSLRFKKSQISKIDTGSQSRTFN